MRPTPCVNSAPAIVPTDGGGSMALLGTRKTSSTESTISPTRRAWTETTTMRVWVVAVHLQDRTACVNPRLV